MTVEVEGRKYRIYWHYEKVERLAVTGISLDDMTTCVVMQSIKRESDGLSVWYNIGVGVIVRYYKDKFDKDLARKKSLTQALDNVSQCEWFGKKERTEIWKAYYKMRNNKW